MTQQAWTAGRLFSSARQDWGTPDALFAAVDREFGFVLDAAATAENSKCAQYLSEAEDGLTQDWSRYEGAVWLNPPYGRAVGDWVRKACEESRRGVAVVVLTFARTDTKWWRDWAMQAAEIRLIPGRVTFAGADNCAPAPSCLLVFDERLRCPRFVMQELPRR